MIVAIGEWVIHTAVRDTKRWLDLHLPLRAVSVNVSAVQFRHPQLPEMVTRCLEQAGLPARRLELELTEGAAVDDPAAALAMMDQLHERGVRLSMDDFGTGYSSLSYLKRFQIYKLKIDQSFVRDLEEDANDRAIVSAIIRMAQALGMQTTAAAAAVVVVVVVVVVRLGTCAPLDACGIAAVTEGTHTGL